MQKLEKTLSNRTDKPVFNIISENKKYISCLFDTGSDVTIYTLGEEELIKKFPSAHIVSGVHADIYGLGTGCSSANIYNINHFEICSDVENKDNIIYKDFYVACMYRPDIKYELVLGAPLFSKMIYTVNKKQNSIIIEHSRQIYSTGYSVKKNDFSKAYRFFSFVQE